MASARCSVLHQVCASFLIYQALAAVNVVLAADLSQSMLLRWVQC
jgi:hypothetical protein